MSPHIKIWLKKLNWKSTGIITNVEGKNIPQDNRQTLFAWGKPPSLSRGQHYFCHNMTSEKPIKLSRYSFHIPIQIAFFCVNLKTWIDIKTKFGLFVVVSARLTPFPELCARSLLRWWPQLWVPAEQLTTSATTSSCPFSCVLVLPCKIWFSGGIFVCYLVQTCVCNLCTRL